jgi:hypothetical protein
VFVKAVIGDGENGLVKQISLPKQICMPKRFRKTNGVFDAIEYENMVGDSLPHWAFMKSSMAVRTDGRIKIWILSDSPILPLGTQDQSNCHY